MHGDSMEEGLPGIWREGYPFLVLRVYYRRGLKRLAEEIIHRLYGRRLYLSQVAMLLRPLGDVAVDTCFTPDDWSNGENLKYSWPTKTFVREVGDLLFEVLPPGRELDALVYKGLLVTLIPLDGDVGVKAAVMVKVPREPRRVVVFYARRGRLYAATAYPPAAAVLARLGFRRLSSKGYVYMWPGGRPLPDIDRVYAALRSVGAWPLARGGKRSLLSSLALHA